MQDLAHYVDVVDDVRRELAERVEAANQAGISADRLVIDPGLGSPRQRSTTGRCSPTWTCWSASACRC
jgi:dihydropteroate synthase